eukprot:IDg12406t1
MRLHTDLIVALHVLSAEMTGQPKCVRCAGTKHKCCLGIAHRVRTLAVQDHLGSATSLLDVSVARRAAPDVSKKQVLADALLLC